MNFWNLRIVLFIIIGLASGRQFCGPDLADVMQLVCNGRGYNAAFTSDFNPSEKRFKRGIVDECCRRGCSWSTLETYCSAANTPNVQIRKRSDIPSKWQPDSSEAEIKIEKFTYETNQIKSEDKISLDNTMSPYPNRFISLWDDKDRHSQPSRSHTLVNKVKRNDIHEEMPSKPDKRASLSFPIDWRDVKMDIEKRGSQLGSIRLRHRKSKISKEGGNPQIGTVPPYFLGRTLVLPPSRKL